MKMRPLREGDYDVVIRQIDAWWGGRPMSGFLPRLFFQHFEDTSFAVEDESGRLAAFLVGFMSQSRPGEAYIHFVGVAPEDRGKGLGRRLYKAFSAAAKARGARLVRAVTSPVNAGSIAFHKAMGFRVDDADLELDGVFAHRDYSGPGQHRVSFTKLL